VCCKCKRDCCTCVFNETIHFKRYQRVAAFSTPPVIRELLTTSFRMLSAVRGKIRMRLAAGGALVAVKPVNKVKIFSVPTKFHKYWLLHSKVNGHTDTDTDTQSAWRLHKPALGRLSCYGSVFFLHKFCSFFDFVRRHQLIVII
jgi:hypothetical protein